MTKLNRAQEDGYDGVLIGIVELLEAARKAAARAVNVVMTTTYWEVGRRIVEFEQGGKQRADYGEEVLAKLAADLSGRFGRGFSERNLRSMRLFYLRWPTRGTSAIRQTASARSIGSKKVQTLSARSSRTFPLPWSHYVTLLGVENEAARAFYEREALAGGWTIRQLSRQVGSQFFERAALSKNKEAMLSRGEKKSPGDAVSAAEEIKDPMVLEFLGLKDEYSETDLEDALIRHLENFLLELGDDFAFVGRQRRLRLDDVWFRIDLLLFHRRLRCLVLLDLKLGRFTHADVGQMNLYLNYARRHWTNPGENPPVGLILCAAKGVQVAEYALDGISNKMLVARYQTELPQPAALARRLIEARERLEGLQARRAALAVAPKHRTKAGRFRK